MGDEPKSEPSESPVDYSDYYSAASSFAGQTHETDLIADSQESDDILIGRKHLLDDSVCLSDPSESGSDSEDPLQDIGISLGTGGLRTEFKKSEKLQFVEFDTSDRAFDENIVARLNKFEELCETIDHEITEPEKSKDVVRETSELLVSIFKNQVPSAYVEMVASQSSGQRFQDWHFISGNTTARRPDAWDVFLSPSGNSQKTSFKDLLRSFGAVDYMPESTEPIITSMYDTMNSLESVAWMCEELEKYVDCSGFTRTFIRFILDRNIFESAECTTSWCSRIYDMLSETHFLMIYFQLVDRENYMLHLRISQQIPEFHKPLLDKLFSKVKQDHQSDLCIKVLSSDNYLQMIYFVLLVYGTAVFPPARSDGALRLKERIKDMREDADKPELTLLRSYVNLYTI
ncbi:LAFA_0D01266g1_1 [Lachancea sp. 'fantastica']|nr:LAFA_0D01266g1_1 [Lachancea sp. 'fantastica']